MTTTLILGTPVLAIVRHPNFENRQVDGLWLVDEHGELFAFGPEYRDVPAEASELAERLKAEV